MEEFKEYIQQFPNYKSDLFDEILPYLNIKHLESGEYFLRQGRTSKRIAFIERGMLRLFYLKDGKEITTCFCKEKTISCSYKSLITKTPSDSSIQAIEPTKIVYFSYDTLQKLYDKNAFWQQVGRLAAENEFLNTECHNRYLNDLSATQRYEDILHNDPELLQRVPLQYLASYMQVAPETLSRIRKKISNLT